jgi:NAD(P)-dependent dehydrogenase (short-subunit alcohol dehydrogenase family)
LDAAAYCVGSVLLKPAHLTTDEEWAETLALNLTGAFRLVRAATRVMSPAGGGALAFCSSVAAGRGLPNHEAIAAAKAGLEGLVRSAAATCAKSKIRVNAVAPGLVKTALTRRLWESEGARKVSEAMHPLGRLGEPGDVASALHWLLDPVQSWVTGQVLGVDGGMGRVQAR